MPILQTHNLSIGYHRPRKPAVVVAAGLDLVLRRGELVCLLGPNGVGKSTLMRSIAGMQKPLGGRVLVAGTEISRLRSRQLATRLSIVLTERPHLGLLNGYALVALGRHPHTDWTGRLSPHDEAVVRWAVDAVGAADLAERMVMELSDGQRQKLMIARALAQESQLILLDEPTAYLDLPRRAEIMRLLRHLAMETGRAILLSTHDLDLALRSADQLWLMSGRGIQAGTPEDLVISGAFEAVFHTEGVTFDRITGTFDVGDENGRWVTVRGHGLPQTWTRRALKRAGYQVTPPDPDAYAYASSPFIPPAIYIEIEDGAHEPLWHLYQYEEQSTHHSIGDLLAALYNTQVKPEMIAQY